HDGAGFELEHLAHREVAGAEFDGEFDRKVEDDVEIGGRLGWIHGRGEAPPVMRSRISTAQALPRLPRRARNFGILARRTSTRDELRGSTGRTSPTWRWARSRALTMRPCHSALSGTVNSSSSTF